MTRAATPPDAVVAAVAASALETLGGRITMCEAMTLGRRTVQGVVRDGWTITALPAGTPSHPAGVSLRPYDRPILAGLARGKRIAQIATDLGVPEETVRSRLFRLRRRMGARCSAHAVALAYRYGWLDGLRPEPRPVVRLADRQRECLALAARGLTNAEIAIRLGLNINTVNVHMRRAYRRLEALDRPHAVALAVQHRHIQLPALHRDAA
jgi:DNA-binding CsgD family transcriptional regulator